MSGNDSERRVVRAPRLVRRTDAGVVDVAYYERRSRRLRVRWLHMVIRVTIRGIVRWYRRRVLEAELRALDDRSLLDVGLSRGDILAIVDGSYASDASRRSRGTGTPNRAPARELSDIAAEQAEGWSRAERPL